MKGMIDMANGNLPPHWQVLATQDPELNDKVQAWKDHIEAHEGLERKYKELLMVSMSCVMRFNSGLRAHAKKALQFGATKAELFAAIEQSFFIGGVPAFREGALVFAEMFPEDCQQ